MSVNTAVPSPTSLGCPSGLAPAEGDYITADPAIFVRTRDGLHSLELLVSGAKCAGCIAKIERGLLALPGVATARLNLSTGKLTAEWRGALPAHRLVTTLRGLGYGAVPFDPADLEAEEDREGRQLVKCLAVAGFAAANVMLLSVSVWSSGEGEMGRGTRDLFHLVSGLIAIPAALYAGQPFFQSAFRALKSQRANMDVPISLAVFLALGVSLTEALSGGAEAYFDAAVMLLFFLLIGRWLDHTLRRRAMRAARDLIALQSTSAMRIDAAGNLAAIPARDIVIGDRLSLAAGDRVPVDVSVEDGTSDVDMSLLTGETDPVTIGKDATLAAGAINLTAPLTVRATSDTQTSTLADLVRLVEAGQQAKSRFTRLADHAARAYVPIVHTLALVTFLGWWLWAGAPVREAIMAATAVLIITCPCALGLATPAVQVVATSQLFRRGILVKTGDALERLAAVRHVVFDKTGTLTEGTLRWTNAASLSQRQTEALAAVARASRHPISRAIVRTLGPGPMAKDVREIPGQGVEGTVCGLTVRLGRAAFVGADPSHDESEGPSAWALVGSGIAVRLSFEDAARDDARATLDALKRSGIGVSLLSGDRRPVVADMAKTLGMDQWTAEATPTDKAAIVDRIAEESGAPVAMVGDGINDTAALAQAAVSLSPGTAASAAQSAADFVFQGDGIGAVATAHRMARRARQHILQNFAFAALYNAVAAPAAMIGLVNPLIAALAMSGSSLVVTLNALRLSADGRRTGPAQ